MDPHGWWVLGIQIVLLLILAPPIGIHLARVLEGRSHILTPVTGGLERLLLRAAGIAADEEMSWKAYAGAFLSFSLLSVLVLYAMQRLQAMLPLDPAGLPGVPTHLAFNTAVSFVSNTNWQSYSGEQTMSIFTQCAGLAVQNFLSAASGIAVAAAVIRGFARRSASTLGSFWVDLVRSTVHLLLPLSVVFAIALVSQGVVQSFRGEVRVHLIEPGHTAQGAPRTEQRIPLGPVASQIAIKQLGTNGGGYFNANSAHPLENPTPLANALETLAILLLPAAMCFTFGEMVRDRRQGAAIFAAMLLLLLAAAIPCILAEQARDPRLAALHVADGGSLLHPTGNMEGKEARFGTAETAIWAVWTTAASNGSVNGMLDSFTPLGGLVPMVLIQLGEVVFGGVGSGLYGMLIFALVAVFMAGLMVGRTPEYLGKKIEAFEVKMAALVILLPSVAVQVGTALAVMSPAGLSSISNPGPHGFSQVLYAFSSAANNNGSAFAGLNAATPFYDIALGLAMLVGRFWVAIPALALAGSLVKRPRLDAGAGTLPTHTPLFVALLAGIVVIVGALTFFPALALGPIAEHLQLLSIATTPLTTGGVR
jgi:K+-transporting ATPase ATPase A chain